MAKRNCSTLDPKKVFFCWPVTYQMVHILVPSKRFGEKKVDFCIIDGCDPINIEIRGLKNATNRIVNMGKAL